MTNIKLITDWLRNLEAGLRHEIEELTVEELSWQPDPEANSIGVTVWHVSRWLDLLTVQALENRPAEEEQWHTRGWAAKTGYDPRGVGYKGYGAVTGYIHEEVAAIPVLSAQEQLTYLSQVVDALCARLDSLPEGALYGPTPGLGGRNTVYTWIKTLLPGGIGHLGEIAALKAMQSRKEYYSYAQGLLFLPNEVGVE